MRIALDFFLVLQFLSLHVARGEMRHTYGQINEKFCKFQKVPFSRRPAKLTRSCLYLQHLSDLEVFDGTVWSVDDINAQCINARVSDGMRTESRWIPEPPAPASLHKYFTFSSKHMLLFSVTTLRDFQQDVYGSPHFHHSANCGQ